MDTNKLTKQINTMLRPRAALIAYSTDGGDTYFLEVRSIDNEGAMSEGRPVFAAGVAVAPPTCWRYYDTVYTERFMRTPKENAAGYARGPISQADKLHGKLLICHGTADDNVHFRNSMEYAEALVQSGKPFMMLPYNNRNHNITGGNTRNHLYTSITNFFIENMK